jgi:serine-threonine kinase receptor-associated protein
MMREGATGDWIGTFIGHQGAVWCTRLNANATKAITGSADFSAKLWNACTGEEVHNFEHKHIVKTVGFSADGELAFTGGAEKKLRVFDMNRLDAEPRMYGVGDYAQTIVDITNVPDPNLLVATARESTVKIWDHRTGKVARTLDSADIAKQVVDLSATEEEKVSTYTGGITNQKIDDAIFTTCHATLDGTMLCTTAGACVAFWDASTFALKKAYRLPRVQDCVAYSPKQGRFVTGSDSSMWVYGYDYETGKEICCQKGHHGPVRSVAITPSGAY